MDANNRQEQTFPSFSTITDSTTQPQEKEWYGASYIKEFINEFKPSDSEHQKETSQGIKPFKRDKIRALKTETIDHGYSNTLVQQEWEGCVTEVNEKTFKAILYNDKEEECSAEFSKDEVSPGDKKLIEVNNIFYWSLGYTMTWTSQRKNMESIIFRRLPAWENFDVNKPSKKARELIEFFNGPKMESSTEE